MDTGIAQALIGGGSAFAGILVGRWDQARRDKKTHLADLEALRPADRDQWDKERTEWMQRLSGRLDDAEGKLEKCEHDNLEKDRVIGLMQVEIADLKRRLSRAGAVLGTDEAAG